MRFIEVCCNQGNGVGSMAMFARRLSSIALLCVAAMSALLTGCGLEAPDEIGNAPSDAAASAAMGRGEGESPSASEPPLGDPKAWLETGVPPLVEPEQPPPFELVGVKFSTNHVDQQL